MTAIVFTAQRKAALEQANLTRSAHRLIKENVTHLGRREGCRLVAAMLDDPTGFVPSMQIGHLLRSAERVGDKAIRRWLGRAQVGSAERRVSELSSRQRELLAGLLRDFGDGARK